MKNNDQKVWTGLEQLEQSPEFIQIAQQEFKHDSLDELITKENALNFTSNRRDFLKYLGFGIGAATVAASCEIPIKKALPYVIKPDTIIPGVATYYASSFVKGGDYCSVLVKTREGRPIKIEGNTLSPVTMGGTSARAQASVLDLYDSNRFQAPLKNTNGKAAKISWQDLDKEVIAKLSTAKNVRVVSNTILSPTAKKAIGEFLSKNADSKWVIYDPVSLSGLLDANQSSFGQRVIPNYNFDKAKTIVGFSCDFLGTWVSPIEFASKYAKTRRIDEVKGATMSRHYHVESHMSMTGSNADNRILVKPSEQGAAIVHLHNAIAGMSGGASIAALTLNAKAMSALNEVAKELVENKGNSIVVSGSNNMYDQIVVNSINNMLGNYGNTIDFGNASLQRQGDDKAMQSLISEMNSGNVGAVIVVEANPLYDLANADQFKQGLSKVGLKVSASYSPNETAAACDYIAPTHHYLESWGDAEPKMGNYSLIQPTISPLFATRQYEESLLRWCGSANLNTSSEQPYYDYLVANWKSGIFGLQKSYSSFQSFWDSTLHDGVMNASKSGGSASFRGDLGGISSKVTQPSNAKLEISFYETINIGDGSYNSNPWLQELPDPVTRTVWGNYVAVPIGWDGGNDYKTFKDLKEGDLVDLEVNGKKQTVGVFTQFGQMPGTIAIAIGYGRKEASMAGKEIGYNAYPWLSLAEGSTVYHSDKVNISEKVGRVKNYACVQYHHTMGVTGMDKETKKKINVDEKTDPTLGSGYQGSIVPRTVIRKTSLAEIDKFVEGLKEERKEYQELNTKTIYPSYKEVYQTGHHWGMHIDLNSCTGCGSCSVACMSENNVPVVGKHEVHRHHEMSWLRIDRYFYGELENPRVVYQPMLCQHCDNAPCENVCPVAATNHSAEGINQMAYNRCIGTRYCANNCPYKVRRFNWLDFTTADIFPANEYPINGEGLRFGADNLTRMVLNPDVTVRTRGVMEKCTFCVQRIQEGKLTAKREGRVLQEGDVKSACQTACPTGAITFGDVNNPESTVSKLHKNELNYIVLEEVNTAPAIQYSARVLNNRTSLDA